MTTRTFNFPVTAASNWFTSLTPMAWTKIASTQTIRSQGPVPYIAAGDGTPNGIAYVTSAWNGAAVDQTRKHLLMVANGGHSAYFGNEGYRLRLDVTPKWERINDPTASADFLPTYNVDWGSVFNKVAYLDGDNRSVHSANTAQFVDGKYWLTFQTTPQYAPGKNSAYIWAFNYDALVADGRLPYPNARNATSLWSSYPITNVNVPGVGSWNGDPNGGFSAAVYDSVGKKIYQFSGEGYEFYYSVSTSGATMGQQQMHSALLSTGITQYSSGGSQFAIYCPDLDIIVYSVGGAAGQVRVMEMAKRRAGNDDCIRQYTVSNGEAWVPQSSVSPGAVYHQGSRSILWSNNGVTRKVAISFTGTAPNRTFSFTQTTLSIPNAPSYSPTSSPAVFGMYSKFNAIQDMGGGEMCLLQIVGVDNDTYACRIRPGDI